MQKVSDSIASVQAAEAYFITVALEEDGDYHLLISNFIGRLTSV
jgi:hypothetical protein